MPIVLVSQFLFWYFVKVPAKIIEGWFNFLKFNMEFFSMPLLLKTLFSQWRRYGWSYPRGLDIPKMLEIFFSNLILRVLGMVMRLILIAIGFISEIVIFVIGAFVLAGWLALPLLLFLSLRYGFLVLTY